MTHTTTHTVGEVAAMSGVTVRTLHHYDEIGLLAPSGRTDAGYRLYDDADIDRLRDILAYRELGLGLDEIAGALGSSGDSLATLRRARTRMLDRIEHLRAIVASLDAAIAADEKGITMSAAEKLSVFGDFDPSEYAEEAKERWGHTDAYAESITRTSGYTADEWQRVMAEAEAIYGRAAELASVGADVAGPEARALVEAHRDHISARFYECTPQIHAGLGTMYVADHRFTENIDKAGVGAAAFLAGAIAAYYAD